MGESLAHGREGEIEEVWMTRTNEIKTYINSICRILQNYMYMTHCRYDVSSFKIAVRGRVRPSKSV